VKPFVVDVHIPETEAVERIRKEAQLWAGKWEAQRKKARRYARANKDAEAVIEAARQTWGVLASRDELGPGGELSLRAATAWLKQYRQPEAECQREASDGDIGKGSGD
jgi:hypothetical protein